MLSKLNDFIIDIIKSKKYFTEDQYNTIKHINNDCIINNDNNNNNNDNDNTTLKNDMQHYIFYFLLEYIKLLVSDNNYKNNDINDLHIFSHAQN
jgi:hypothetical protein